MGELRKMKKYEELKFQDDFMFGKVMEDMELSRDLLQCLLQKPVGEMTAVQAERDMEDSIYERESCHYGCPRRGTRRRKRK